MSECTSLRPKSPTHKTRRLNPVPSALEGRVQPGEEIVQMGGNNAHAFGERGRPALQDEGDGEHGPWKVFDGDLDDDKGNAFTAVVGGVSVG